ncbi:MAG: head-tail connector protein [Allosphingosinicella sp.]
MIEGEALVLPPEAAGAAKAYLRVERADEDALIAGLVAAAAELCEAFIGEALLERGFIETIPASRAWRRLSRGPVRAITPVEALSAQGAAQAIPVDGYGIDIDSQGDGWVRLTGSSEVRRIRVGYQAGLAGTWADLPAALRQGILRLGAHFYTNRAAEGGRASEPPAAVAALWRPFRRLRLHGGRGSCSNG